ncbi:ATP-binding protein, partial [Klebsiella pneumoniae]|nr:ATP-binding protein [Klebsiella pneumoniae]
MPIEPLPEDCIRALGATLVVTDPVSLVKELLDNSIDASATFVEISLSANTVDKVQVRDNGCGIQHDDFNALGRRGY